MKMLLRSIPGAFALFAVVQALLVEQSSPQCAQLCGNSLDSTSGSEITCSDSAYATSAYGAAFKACLSCQLSSTYFDPHSKTSDLHWALYNLRFALSWCLFGWENNTQAVSTPCLTSYSCGTLQNAFEYSSLSPNATSYSFCPLLPSITVPKCTSCLAEMNDEHYLMNFVTVLEAACEQQPVPGGTLSLQGSVFSSTRVNITVPSATPISTYTPSTGGLSLGAKLGIIAGGIVFMLVVAGFLIVCFGKRRRRRVLAEKARSNGYEWQVRHNATLGTPQQHDAPFFDSPQSQRPFANAWGQDDSPASANVEKVYFSPYSSQYTSPVSAVDASSRTHEWPKDSKRAFQSFGLHEDHGEDIEMVGVEKQDTNTWRDNATPVLSHPGNGRGEPDYSGYDVKTGHAI